MNDSQRTNGFGVLLCIAGVMFTAGAAFCRVQEPEYTIEDMGKADRESIQQPLRRDPLRINDEGVVIESGYSFAPGWIVRDGIQTPLPWQLLDVNSKGDMIVKGRLDPDEESGIFFITEYGKHAFPLPAGSGTPQMLNESGQVLTSIEGGFGVLDRGGALLKVKFPEREPVVTTVWVYAHGDSKVGGYVPAGWGTDSWTPENRAVRLSDSGQVLGIVYKGDMELGIHVRSFWVWEKWKGFQDLDLGKYKARYGESYPNEPEIGERLHHLAFSSNGQILLSVWESDDDGFGWPSAPYAYIFYSYPSGKMRKLSPAELSREIMGNLPHIKHDGIPTFGKDYEYLSMNDDGIAVGNLRLRDAAVANPEITDNYNILIPIVYKRGRVRVLQELIPEDSGWTLWTAIDINNRGQIVGTGNLDGEWRRYRLTPVKAGFKPFYSDYFVNLSPSVPEVMKWGIGFPVEDAAGWEDVIPESVVTQQHIDGWWVILAVFGKNLFAMEGETPEVTWAYDGHPEYKLLHSGTFTTAKANGSEDEEWSKFWRAFSDRRDLKTYAGIQKKNMDVYIVGVRIDAGTPAGPSRFKIGRIDVHWTLPLAANAGATHFVRQLTGKDELGAGEYERINSIFKNDNYHVEIKLDWQSELATWEGIPFELMLSRKGGEPTIVSHMTSEGKSTTFYAKGTAEDPRLFRSNRFFVQVPGGANAWRKHKGDQRECGIAMGPGDRLAARILPHGVARQGEMGIVKMYTAPANVGAFWRESVMKAAEIVKIKPPRAWERLSREELGVILRKPWDTVETSALAPGDANRTIKLSVGDLAAMLLIRQRFMELVDGGLPRLQQLRKEANKDPSLIPLLHSLLRPDATKPGSAIGDIKVSIYEPAMPSIAIETVYKTELRNVYDERWLKQHITLYSDRVAWQSKAVLEAFNNYVKAVELAYKKARDVDLTEAEDLLRVASVGMSPVANNIKPNLLYLVEKPNPTRPWEDLYWEIDATARGYVGTIGRLGDEFVANENYADKEDALVMSIASVASVVLLPETMAGHIVSRAMGAYAAYYSQTDTLPNFLASKDDIKFAIGAYSIVGNERYVAAQVLYIPAWQMALELVGGWMDLGIGTWQAVRGANGWFRMRSDKEIVELFDLDPRSFAMLASKEQAPAFTRLGQLFYMQKTGQALTKVESSVLSRGLKMMTEMDTIKATPSVRHMHPSIVGEATTIIVRNGKTGFVTPTSVLDNVSGVATRRDTVQLTVASKRKPLFSLPPNESWSGFQVGTRKGNGSFFVVYLLTDDKKSVFKVTRDLSEGLIAVERVDHCSDMIDNIMPQLKNRRTGKVGRVGFIVQERIPDGAIKFEKVLGEIPGDTLSPGLREWHNYQRTVGVRRTIEGAEDQADAVSVMTQAETHATCRLFKKGIDNDIIWFDGHLDNISLVKEKNGLIAKVVDQDFFWEWKGGKRFWEGPVGRSQGGVLFDLYEFNDPYYRLRMQSMTGHRAPANAQRLLASGTHLYPDARFFMYKMMERWGYVNYVRGKGWTDGAMKLEHVLEIFRDFEDAKYIDPDLGKMLPGQSFRIRPERLPDPATSDIPYRKAA